MNQTIKKLGIKPPVDPSIDVFNPLICQGPLFSAADAARIIKTGESAGVLGKYAAYVRTRSCNLLNGCGSWRKDIPMGKAQAWFQEKDGVSATLATTLDSPFFTMSLVHNFANGYQGITNSKTIVSGRPDKLMYPAATEVGSGEIARYYNVAYTTKIAGAFRQSCGWFLDHVTMATTSDGTYLESDLVYYGIR